MDKKEEVINLIKDRLSELLNVNIDDIKEDQLLVEDLGATSIMIVDLFVSLEDAYGVDMQNKLDLTESLTITQLAEKVVDASVEEK